MSTLSQLSVLNDSLEQDTILAKLPRNLLIRWIKFFDNWQHGDFKDCHHEPRNEHPPFSRLCEFIEKEARILCNPLLERQSSTVNVTNQSVKRGPQSVSKGPIVSLPLPSILIFLMGVVIRRLRYLMVLVVILW
jgi:hypothetical protein